MNSSNPKFWALIGFIFGAIIAAGGSMASPIESLVGGIVQSAIWFGVSSLIIKNRGSRASNTRKKFDYVETKKDTSTASKPSSRKICDKCKSPVPMAETSCLKCRSTSFSHIYENAGFVQETSEEALSRIFEIYEPVEVTDSSEFKICPMCAEQIRFAAKKCRYCQHLM